VLELNDLVKAIEEEFGVTAAAPVAVAAPGAEAEAAEEKTEFDVILTSPGGSKINVIKVVRSITGLGLKEAKALVDEAPKPVNAGVPKEEAEEIKSQLEEAGATVEMRWPTGRPAGDSRRVAFIPGIREMRGKARGYEG